MMTIYNRNKDTSLVNVGINMAQVEVRLRINSQLTPDQDEIDIVASLEKKIRHQQEQHGEEVRQLKEELAGKEKENKEKDQRIADLEEQLCHQQEHDEKVRQLKEELAGKEKENKEKNQRIADLEKQLQQGENTTTFQAFCNYLRNNPQQIMEMVVRVAEIIVNGIIAYNGRARAPESGNTNTNTTTEQSGRTTGDQNNNRQ